MSDRKAELERKKLRLQQMRDEKKRKEEEKRRKEVGSIDFLCSPRLRLSQSQTPTDYMKYDHDHCLIYDHYHLF